MTSPASGPGSCGENGTPQPVRPWAAVRSDRRGPARVGNGRRIQTILCIGVLLAAIPLNGCGTLFYSERRGQDGGDIDPVIVVLDGIGLLIYIIPGLIAYAVDFATGAIYLPGTDGILSVEGIGSPDADQVAAAVSEHIGRPVSLSDAVVSSRTVRPDEDVGLLLERLAIVHP